MHMTDHPVDVMETKDEVDELNKQIDQMINQLNKTIQ
jgi:HAMP domain-containing protein